MFIIWISSNEGCLPECTVLSILRFITPTVVFNVAIILNHSLKIIISCQHNKS